MTTESALLVMSDDRFDPNQNGGRGGKRLKTDSNSAAGLSTSNGSSSIGSTSSSPSGHSRVGHDSTPDRPSSPLSFDSSVITPNDSPSNGDSQNGKDLVKLNPKMSKLLSTSAKRYVTFLVLKFLSYSSIVDILLEFRRNWQRSHWILLQTAGTVLDHLLLFILYK